MSNTDDIILDFFSGSATTAHAVMQLNAEDGGNRRFILVQLPELCDEKSEAYKAGYKNICEIGKERIRRAGKMLKDALESSGLFVRAMKRHQDQHDSLEGFAYAEWEESPEVINAKKEMAAKLDVGFRVFKLDTSNLKTWDLLAPGREIAERIYGRHRLLTHFFMQLGVDEKTAAEDACKAEHILSEQTLEKIRESALRTDAAAQEDE